MKNEIINCFTWYANKVAEIVQYESWSDELCRKEIKQSTDTFLAELNKHIDWNNLTSDTCKELRFALWSSNADIDEEIEQTKKNFEENREKLIAKGLTLENEIEKLERTKGIRLIPLYLLPLVPIGTELFTISGNSVIYDGSNVDKDVRFGCIAYGIKIKEEKLMEIKRETKVTALTTDNKPMEVGNTYVFNAVGRCFAGKYLGMTKKEALIFDGVISGSSCRFHIMPNSISEIYLSDIDVKKNDEREGSE